MNDKPTIDELLRREGCELLLNTTENIQGKRLAQIRKDVLKLSQEGFAHWLFDKGIKGNFNGPYKGITVAAWENGRRNIPEEVIKCISENVAVNEGKVQYAYLKGESPYISKSYDSVFETTYTLTNTMEKLSNEIYGCSDIIPSDEQININTLGNICLMDILPIFGLDYTDIFDNHRFSEYMYHGVKHLVDEYIEKEKKGM